MRAHHLNKCNHSASTIQLYNIDDDPLETCNLSQEPENRDIVIDLLKRLQVYSKESVPVFSPPWDINSHPALHGDAWRPWLDNDLDTFVKLYRFLFYPFMK